MMRDMLGPDAVEWHGVLYTFLLRSADTGGATAIVDSVSRPASGPPRHIHGDCDETFVVLSGDVVFEVDGETRACGPGQAAFVPRGAEHSFHVLGPAPARMLTIFTPGGFEAFFEAMGEGGYAFPADMGRIEEIGHDFHLTFTGPPLEPSVACTLTGDLT